MKRSRKKPGPGLRTILALFFWAFIAIGVVLGALIARRAVLYHDSKEWPTTNGVVTSSAVTRHYIPPQDWGYDARRTSGMYVYQASIEYDYTVDGRRYSGNRVGISCKADPSRLVERYPEGQAITVYYDERHPGRALLIPGVDFVEMKFNLVMLSILPVIGIIGLVWLARRRG